MSQEEVARYEGGYVSPYDGFQYPALIPLEDIRRYECQKRSEHMDHEDRPPTSLVEYGVDNPSPLLHLSDTQNAQVLQLVSDLATSYLTTYDSALDAFDALILLGHQAYLLCLRNGVPYGTPPDLDAPDDAQ